MNLEHYKNFVTIVDIGTITAAAEKLLIAQPALSKQLQHLEATYGTKLVIRKPRHIELTDAGKILYDKVKSICYLEDAAQKEIDACIKGNKGTLRVGCSPSSPDPILDPLFLDFHAAYPDINFEMYELNSNQLMEVIQTGLVEVGVIRSQHFIPAYLRPVLTVKEHVMAYYHKNHSLLSAEQQSIPLKMLQNLPISISAGLKNGFSLACENAGFQPNYVNTSMSRALSMLLSKDRFTVSILVAQKSFDNNEFSCRPIEVDKLDTLRFFAVQRSRQISAVAETFISYCREHPLMIDWVHNE